MIERCPASRGLMLADELMVLQAVVWIDVEHVYSQTKLGRSGMESNEAVVRGRGYGAEANHPMRKIHGKPVIDIHVLGAVLGRVFDQSGLVGTAAVPSRRGRCNKCCRNQQGMCP